MTTRRTRSTVRRTLATTLALGLVAAACGDDTSNDDATSAAEDTRDPVEPVEGCEEAVTDPADLGADRPIARCEPGAPAAQPLDETTEVTLAVADLGFLIYAPQFLAETFGEFEAENLDVEIVALHSRDAIPQTVAGDIDAFLGAPDAGLFNALDQDIPLKWVMGNFFPTDAGDDSVAQTGVWANQDLLSDPDDPDIADLEGAEIASIATGSVTFYPIAEALAEGGLTMDDVSFTEIGSADMVQALNNEAVDAAWLLDPFWTEVSDDPNFVQVASQPPGEPIGGMFFAPSLAEEEPEVGEALVRAMIRTINTYLTDEWYEDDETVEALADYTGLSADAVRGSVTSTFDWEIREGTTDRMQDVFTDTDMIDIDAPFPEDEVVDRSFYLRAVGAESEQ